MSDQPTMTEINEGLREVKSNLEAQAALTAALDLMVTKGCARPPGVVCLRPAEWDKLRALLVEAKGKITP